MNEILNNDYYFSLDKQKEDNQAYNRFNSDNEGRPKLHVK